jgi:hypothetical protein
MDLEHEETEGQIRCKGKNMEMNLKCEFSVMVLEQSFKISTPF